MDDGALKQQEPLRGQPATVVSGEQSLLVGSAPLMVGVKTISPVVAKRSPTLGVRKYSPGGGKHSPTLGEGQLLPSPNQIHVTSEAAGAGRKSPSNLMPTWAGLPSSPFGKRYSPFAKRHSDSIKVQYPA